MSTLKPSHPISRALKKAKNISKDLVREFKKFLAQFEDWEGQALYLLDDKGEKIERIVEDLYDVPLKDQSTWKKPRVEKSYDVEESPEPIKEVSLSTVIGDTSTTPDYYPQFSFKDWKQEHGFDSIPVEVGDIHTIIRFERILSKDREEKFRWSINRARYGIRGWGNEKPIQSLNKSLLDNNNNPGWVVKTFLDENKLLTDGEDNPIEDDLIPNPFVVSSRDSHALIFLHLGHPFLYYKDNQNPIRNSGKKVEFDINVHTLANHRILSGIFYHTDKGNRLPIISEDFVDSGLILYGLPKAIVFDNKYYQILPTLLPAKMIRDSFKGILVPNDEWNGFISRWEQWYPEIELCFMDSTKVDPPNFEARTVKEWRYWLTRPEKGIGLFKSDDDITYVRMHEETKLFNTNRLAITIENYDGENTKLVNPTESLKAAKFFQVLKTIYQSKRIEDFFSVERHAASQLLILAEEYPYAFGCEGQPLISDNNVDFRITVTRNLKNENQYLLKGGLGFYDEKRRFIEYDTKDDIPKAIGVIPSFILENDQLTRIGSMLSGRLINDTLAGVVVEESEISDFYAAALPYLRQRNIPIHDPKGILRVSALFNYRLHANMTIWEVKGVMMGRLDTQMQTDIGDHPYPLDLNTDEFKQTLDGKKYKVPKDRTQEAKLKEELVDTGWVDEGDGDFSMREDHSLVFVLEVLPNRNPDSMITYLGGTKLRRWKAKQLVPTISTNIQSGIDWFEVDVSMKIGEQTYDLKEIIKLWQNNEQAIELDKGQGVAVIDKEWLEKYAPILNRLMKTSKNPKGKKQLEEEENEGDQAEKLKVDKYQVGLLSELENIATEKQSDEEWDNILKKISSFKGLKSQRIPKNIQAVLRDYQKEGVNWLCFLNEFGFGGILADDMGLGKTLQTLTFLTILKKRRYKNPSLVIAPTSVVTNWMAEIDKFTPHLKAVLLHGQKRKDHFDAALKADLIITTYGLLQRDLEWLSGITFNLVILDEAQNIKNARSKTAQAVMELNARRRLTLTGTPIENSVTELWSQFNFLMPGFFGALKEFERDFVKPKTRRDKRKKPNHSLLRKQTKPFILRRLKKNVAKELPPKTEQVLYCEMKDNQKKLYNSVLELVRQQVKDKISAGGVKGARIAIFDALLKLRQICCDPRLSSLAGNDPPISAKYVLFMETVTDIVSEGHRVLVFSQFVKMLNLIQKDLDEKNIPYLQLDGTSKNREQLVNKFQQSDEYPIFLISLKAGGTGINLTAADYVIHYDPWWNPAVEAQATDRAYRIGQKTHLFV
ncbi:MAG: DEAD/DEAH box helicase, partial [Proteobacteria bacterium]|nr:DEAD/DEAH box helicase [Pseudomonadota bacterium]